MTPVEPKQRRKDIENICAPIFDGAMGLRLALMRKRLLMDQTELGDRLGLPQKTISELENGKLSLPRFHFTVARLRGVFPADVDHILFGTGAARYNFGHIESKYFDVKFRKERKPRVKREHWTYKALRAGMKTQNG